MRSLTDAWRVAGHNSSQSQAKQKSQYDIKAGKTKFKVGNKVMVFMSHETTGTTKKVSQTLLWDISYYRA